MNRQNFDECLKDFQKRGGFTFEDAEIGDWARKYAKRDRECFRKAIDEFLGSRTSRRVPTPGQLDIYYKAAVDLIKPHLRPKAASDDVKIVPPEIARLYTQAVQLIYKGELTYADAQEWIKGQKEQIEQQLVKEIPF